MPLSAGTIKPGEVFYSTFPVLAFDASFSSGSGTWEPQAGELQGFLALNAFDKQISSIFLTASAFMPTAIAPAGSIQVHDDPSSINEEEAPVIYNSSGGFGAGSYSGTIMHINVLAADYVQFLSYGVTSEVKVYMQGYFGKP